MKEKLIAIKENLEHIDIHGERNLYLMLGAMQELGKLIEQEANNDG